MNHSFPDVRGIQPGNQEKRERLQPLDAVRGIAAFLVVVGHSLEEALRISPDLASFGPVIEQAFVEHVSLGRVGVIAFFLVSGYVIPFSFGHARPLCTFLIARFFRLYPAYWVSLAGAVVVLWSINGHPPPTQAIVANVTMAQVALRQPDIIGVYWTLFYELVFYGLCMVWFIAGRLEAPMHLFWVICGLCAIGFAAALLRGLGINRAIPIGLFMFLAIMHLGTLARLVDRGIDPSARKAFFAALAVVLLSCGPISAIGFIQRAAGERLVADVSSVYIGLLLFFFLRNRSAVVSTTSVFFGRISYSLYLFHPLALLLGVATAKARFTPLPGAIFVILIVPIASILIATLSQRFVEAPANEFGRALRRRVLGT